MMSFFGNGIQNTLCIIWIIILYFIFFTKILDYKIFDLTDINIKCYANINPKESEKY